MKFQILKFQIPNILNLLSKKKNRSLLNTSAIKKKFNNENILGVSLWAGLSALSFVPFRFTKGYRLYPNVIQLKLILKKSHADLADFSG
jgi:hypothetical protein